MNDVVESRIARIRARMRENDVDMLMIGPSADMHYMIGRRLPETERFNAVVMAAKGRPAIVAPLLQAPLVQDLAQSCDILAWTEAEDPLALVVDRIAKSGARRVAVNGRFQAGFLLPLQRRAAKAEFIDAAAIIAPLRLRKDAREIAVLEDAALRFDRIWRDFFAHVRILGMTERQIAARLGELAADHGFGPLAWCDVGGGPNGASPLHHGSDRAVKRGDPVVIDFAATLEGYFTDTCRTPVAAEAHPEFVAIYDIVNRAHEAACAAARPGVAAEAPDRAARKVITDAGYGRYFVHRLGHGLGIDAHEEPYIVEGNSMTLEPGMVFSNEPGIYIPDRWGVRIENIMTITDDGCRALNKLGRELVVMS